MYNFFQLQLCLIFWILTNVMFLKNEGKTVDFKNVGKSIY